MNKMWARTQKISLKNNGSHNIVLAMERPHRLWFSQNWAGKHGFLYLLASDLAGYS